MPAVLVIMEVVGAVLVSVVRVRVLRVWGVRGMMRAVIASRVRESHMLLRWWRVDNIMRDDNGANHEWRSGVA